MKKRLTRLVAIGIALIMMFLVVEPVWATTISDLEKEKERIEQQKKEADERKKQEQANYNSASGKVDSIQSEVDEIEGEIDEIDAALVETLASVEMIKEDISAKEVQIEETSQDLVKAQEVEQEQYESMKLRIRFMYEKGDVTYLQLLLESQGFGEMVNKVEYVEKLYEYDQKKLEEYQIARQAVEDLKQKLEDEHSELEAQKHVAAGL